MSSRRVLLRAAKSPFAASSAARTIEQNLIATNSGNLLFSSSAYRMLSTSGTEVVTNGPRLNGDPADAGRINDEYDAFVIPLANAFRPDFARHLASLTELVEQLTIPVTVLGVGAQTDLDYDTSAMRPLDEAVSRFVRAVLERSPSVGVRGELTERYLRELGFSDVEVVGCPSMFLHGTHLAVRDVGPLDASARVALSVSNWVDGVGALVAEALVRHPESTYFAQELKDLKVMTWGDLSRETGAAAVVPDRLSHPLLAPGRAVFPLDPSPWVEALRGYDVAVGTRIHGNIAALLAGTPALVLCHDSRTLELSRYFEIPHVRADRVSGWDDVVRALETADHTALVDGHDKRLRRMLDFVESHGLEHVYGAGGDEGRAYDERVAAAGLPGLVPVWEGHDDGLLGYRVASLRQDGLAQSGRLRRQERETVALRTRAESAEQRADRLSRDLAAQAGRVDALTRRLAALEQQVAEPGPVGRVLRAARRRAGRARRWFTR